MNVIEAIESIASEGAYVPAAAIAQSMGIKDSAAFRDTLSDLVSEGILERTSAPLPHKKGLGRIAVYRLA